MEQWEKELAEIRAIMAETAKKSAETEKLTADNAKAIAELSKNIGGISRKNGKMAEEYFFNSLNQTKTLGGVHFDEVERNLKNRIPIGNGKTLDGEYDIALINKNSLGIVEVKYSIEKEDVENLVEKQVKNFKLLFPMYADYKFYLAVGGMSIDKQAEEAAKKLGVGILKLNGDAVEIQDKKLKVY